MVTEILVVNQRRNHAPDLLESVTLQMEQFSSLIRPQFTLSGRSDYTIISCVRGH